MQRKSVSVAMAAYNGERYIDEQIKSIVSQLNEQDELMISLDPSTDRSKEIINDLTRKDGRIHLLQGPGKGVINNFENAIQHAKNEVVFLADQDDIWLPGKVKRVVEEFNDPQVQVVMHDASIVDENLKVQIQSFFQYRKVKTGIKKNIMKNSYMGCCMAFRNTLKQHFLPFPQQIPMHDQWIGLVGEIVGKNILVPEIYLLYRRHGDNETDLRHASLMQMIKWRKSLYKEIKKKHN